MASIFNLYSDVKQLPPVNRGMSKMNYLRVSPDRNSRLAEFSNGNYISFKFTCNGTQWWQPSKSYLRLDLELKDAGQGVPTVASDIAFNMGVCGSLFQSAELLLAGRSIQKIGDHLSEIDALSARMNRSRTWLAGAGDSLNYWETDYKKRVADTASDGNGDPTVPVAPDVDNRVALGYDAATNRFSITAGGEVTFDQNNGAALPDATQVFQVGDYFQWGPDNLRARIAAVTSPTTLQLDGAQTIVAANAGAFARVRYVGIAARRNNVTQVCWTPPLSVFGLKHCLPAGDYELKLQPRNTSDINNVCIESASGATGSVSVNQIFFNANIVEGDRVVDKNYIMDLDVISAHEETIQSTDLTQYNFNVAENTHGLTMAIQDTRTLNSTSYPVTKFKVGRDNDELKLNRFFLQYANSQYPQPDSDMTFLTGTDRTIQRYADTQLNIGAMNDSGSPETIEDWHDRGAYYSFRVVKDGSDRSTRAVVNASFEQGLANAKVLLFSHHKQAAFVSIRNGAVFNVDVRNI